MLKKCLKYDFLSIIKIWGMASLVMLSLAVAAGLVLRGAVTAENYPDDDYIFKLLVVGLYYISIGIFVFVNTILLNVRYYSNFFTDEGYLTFTLPVSRSLLYRSKILNSIIYQAMTIVMVIFSVCIVLSIVPDPDTGNFSVLATVIAECGEFFRNALRNMEIWIVVYIFEIIVLVALTVLASTIMLYMIITVCCVHARKHKIISVIGVVIASHYVLSFLMYVLIFCLILWFSSADVIFGSALDGTKGNIVIALLLLLFCSMMGTVCVLMSNITKGCLERKLNLS